jgi:F-type H+-transporting ATPase subunit alpha
LLDHITNDDPKIKGEVEDKIRSALDEYTADFS